MKHLWKFFTSLRLTVTLLAISVLLVWLGSIAQVSEGLWNAQERWFKSWVVYGMTPFPFVFPGGHLLGTLLLINLIAAHIKRFHWSFTKFGIQLTHAGIIMLIFGQLLTDKLAIESYMSFREGETKSYTEHHRDAELVFITDVDADHEQVVSIPEARLRDKGGIQNEKLPFSVRVLDYQINGEVIALEEAVKTAQKLTGAMAAIEGQYASAEGALAQLDRAMEMPGRSGVWRDALKAVGEPAGDDLTASAKAALAKPEVDAKLREELKKQFRNQMLTAWQRQGGEMAYVARETLAGRTVEESKIKAATSAGAGSRFFSVAMPEAKSMDSRNLPFATIELLQGGQSMGTWLVSPQLREQKIEVGGKTIRLVLRPQRFYVPYSMKLLKTTHEVYQGTDIPKNFQSRVLINNPQSGENRETDIYMNNPLRYAGVTFYQYQMGADQANSEVKTSTLQVVENPSWLAPYAGCLVVSLGMVWQFLFHLAGFMSKRTGLPRPDSRYAHGLLKLCALLVVVPDVLLVNLALKSGSGMMLTAAAVSIFVRCVIAWELWRGRFVGFILFLLLVATLLALPFAVAFSLTLGPFLWPLVVAQFAALACILTVILTTKPVTV